MVTQNPEKENKSINRSVRMSPSVFAFILRAEGKSFNEKFNNLIEFCMTRERILHDIEEEHRKKLSELQSQLNNMEERLQKNNELKKHLTLAYEALQDLYKPDKRY